MHHTVYLHNAPLRKLKVAFLVLIGAVAKAILEAMYPSRVCAFTSAVYPNGDGSYQLWFFCFRPRLFAPQPSPVPRAALPHQSSPQRHLDVLDLQPLGKRH